MLVSSSDGCCLDGLVAAILLRAAAMIAVEDEVGRGDGWFRSSCGSDPGVEFVNVGAARLVLSSP